MLKGPILQFLKSSLQRSDRFCHLDLPTQNFMDIRSKLRRTKDGMGEPKHELQSSPEYQVSATDWVWHLGRASIFSHTKV